VSLHSSFFFAPKDKSTKQKTAPLKKSLCFFLFLFFFPKVPKWYRFCFSLQRPQKRTQSPRQRFKGTRCPHEPQSLEQNVLQKVSKGKQNKSNRELNNSTVEVPFFPFVVYKAPKRKKNWFGSRRERGETPTHFPHPTTKREKGTPGKEKGKNPPVSAQHSFFFLPAIEQEKQAKALLFFPLNLNHKGRPIERVFVAHH